MRCDDGALEVCVLRAADGEGVYRKHTQHGTKLVRCWRRLRPNRSMCERAISADALEMESDRRGADQSLPCGGADAGFHSMCAAIDVGEGITAAAALCSRLAVESNDDVIAFLGDKRRIERDLHRDVAGVVAERGVLFRLHDGEALINLGYRAVVAAAAVG